MYKPLNATTRLPRGTRAVACACKCCNVHTCHMYSRYSSVVRPFGTYVYSTKKTNGRDRCLQRFLVAVPSLSW